MRLSKTSKLSIINCAFYPLCSRVRGMEDPSVLSFDEFSAIRNRERGPGAGKGPSSSSAMKQTIIKEEVKKEVTFDGKNKNPAADNDDGSSQNGKASFSSKQKRSGGLLLSIGDFMEMHETQMFCIILILLDSYSGYLLSILQSVIGDLESNDAKIVLENIIPMMKNFTAFTQIYFIVELVMIFLSFGLSVLGHLGYTVDFVILATQFYADLVAAGRESRVLNVFRLWRTYRLLISLVNIEKEAHDETKAQVEELDAANRKIEMEKSNIEEDLKREKEARTSVEAMLADYKEEVDTLNEALKIAARDIAEVGEADDDLFLTDDELEGADESGGGDAESKVSGGSMKSKASSQGPITFVVNSDGTFDQR